MESIHDLWRHVREHPDFVLGVIFLRSDFPVGQVPNGIESDSIEELLTQRAWNAIDTRVTIEETDV